MLSYIHCSQHKIAGPSKAPKARAVPKAKGKVKHPHTKAEAKERIRHSQKVHKTRKVPVFKDVWVGNVRLTLHLRRVRKLIVS